MLLYPKGIHNILFIIFIHLHIIKSEMSEDNMAEMEALLVVESYHFVKFELILEQINLAAKNGKNIVLARKIDKNEYSEVLDICEKSNVKLIEMPIESFKWEKNISGLQNINVPVIAIIENGVRCNAFEIEMQIISVLLKENYKVSLISSRQFGNTENIHAFPGFMNGNGLNESEKIICYNQYLKYIESHYNLSVSLLKNLSYQDRYSCNIPYEHIEYTVLLSPHSYVLNTLSAKLN